MSNIIPENALKLAEEQVSEENWEIALETLHQSLRNRKNARGNNLMLEKIVVRFNIIML